jgi:hypothetical protein
MVIRINDNSHILLYTCILLFILFYRKRIIHYYSGSQTFSVHGALSISGFFHGVQSQKIGLPNSCSGQLVRLGWLS